jgi:hypothetical protein
MTRKSILCCILLAFIYPAQGSPLVVHDLQVELNPDKHYLHVIDHIELGEHHLQQFLLHEGLKPHSLTPGVTITPQGTIDGPIPIVAYRLSMPEEQQTFTLEYDGEITHELRRSRESPGRSQQRLPGTVSPEGVYLDAGVAWYPYFQESFQAFSMRVTLPSDWLAISQGQGPKIEDYGSQFKVSWQEIQPQDDIYLVAGPYQLYQRESDGISAQVYLHQADASLAERYLSATEQYLALYQQLIGDYPYAKFALVENFWESGYGMPSFTLLGRKVIRLPFILHTSYPHEILHNWWGNSVYIDYDRGNWAEGLTTYLADHLLAEQQGRGDQYRRDQLQHYSDFIHRENDFPLNRFRGRHGSASQAVGYGKSLMMFHMLRRHLGDKAFLEGVQRFYQNNRFKLAGYPDLQQAFEQDNKDTLDEFFETWLTRTGAPKLSLTGVKLKKLPNGYRIEGRILQTQAAPPFPIELPIVVHQENQEPQILRIPMKQRDLPFNIELSNRPLQLDIDPWFDLFRQLYPQETPPTVSSLLGSKRLLILIPADAEPALRQAYQALAKRWSEGYPEIEIVLDSEINQLPDDRPVWLLGWENRFKTAFLTGLDGYPFDREAESLQIQQHSYPLKSHSFALVNRQSAEGEPQAWLATHSPQALPGLARKLPHYGKYSYLAFQGDTPDNVLKGQWPVTASPLRKSFTQNKMPLQTNPPKSLVSRVNPTP